MTKTGKKVIRYSTCFKLQGRVCRACPAAFDLTYDGVNPVLGYGQIQVEFAAGKHSTINKRYHRMPQGEPVQK